MHGKYYLFNIYNEKSRTLKNPSFTKYKIGFQFHSPT